MATLFRNGNILTLDEDNRSYSAMLIEGDTILSLGHNPDDWQFDPETKIVDLEGKTLIPGFNDNHIHLNFLGDSVEIPDLTGLNENEIIEKLKGHYGNPQKKQMIIGARWDYPACSNPSLELLDSAFPDNPVMLSQYGGHALWVNSLILKKIKQEKNNRSGLIKEVSGIAFFERLYIKKLINKRLNEKNIGTALKKCFEYGITSVQDNTWSFVSVNVLKDLFRRGKLTSRVSCWAYGDSPLFRFIFNLQQFIYPDVTKGPVKFFLDGTLTARTAWVMEPYANMPDNRGSGKSKKQILSFLRQEVKKRNQIALHAIGDQAISEFLDALEELSEEYDHIPELRIRLEHAQLISPGDYDRIKKLGVLICAQPSALNNPQKDIGILGRERAEKAYPYRSLLDMGIPLSFGSDAPGEDTLNPFEAMSFAVNRKGPEKISITEALKCYTSGSAYAEFKETEKGMLKPGMAADFIVLSRDPLQCPPEDIARIKVLETYVAGKRITSPH